MTIEQKTKKTIEQSADPVVLKQQMFKGIVETFPEYRELAKHTEIDPVGFVFQHSVADGLELAKKLNLTPDEIKKRTIQNPFFVLSHKKLIERTEVLMYLSQVQPDVHFKNNILQTTTLRGDEEKRVFFESHLEKRRNDMDEFPDEVIESIGNYYAEFLPYRVDQLGKSQEQFNQEKGYTAPKFHLEESLESGKKILFEKYMEALSKEIELRNGSEPLEATLVTLGIPSSEIVFVKKSLENYIEGKENKGKFPTLTINHGAGKINMNLEATRKPVAKIKEKVITNNIIKDAEQYNHGQTQYYSKSLLKITYDEQLNEYIPNYFNRDTKSISREQIDQYCFECREFFQQLDYFIKKLKEKGKIPDNWVTGQYPNYHSFLSDLLQMRLYRDFSDAPEIEPLREELEQRSGLIRRNDSALHLINLSLDDQLQILPDDLSPDLKIFLEKAIISQTFNYGRNEGVAKFLRLALDGKKNLSISYEDLHALFDEYKDSILSRKHRKKGDYAYSSDIPMKEAYYELDCLKNPTLENLINYFEPKTGQEAYDDAEKNRITIRTIIEKSQALFDQIKFAMKNKAQWLLESFSMPAKPDGDLKLLAARLMRACYPEQWNEYRERKEMNTYKIGNNPDMDSAVGMTENKFETSMDGGNVGAKKNSTESKESASVFEAIFDKSIKAMLVTNIVGYDNDAKIWKRTYVPVDGDMLQNRKLEKVSAKLKNPINETVSVIPSPLGVQGVSSNKNLIETDSLGIHTAVGDDSLKSWSYDIPVGNVSIDQVSESTYTRFLDRFIDEGGTKYLEKMQGLPTECMMFLDKIKDLSPRDRVEKIQKFITEHSFYDSYDNQMRDQMNDADIAVRLELMQERLSQLREELGDEVPEKMFFAGVCADFSIVGEMMLKESGIAAGIAEGYHISGTKINNGNNAHALNVIFWPDETGKTIIAEVEMTPPAITAAQQMAYSEQGLQPEMIQDSINEAEKREKEHQEELKERSDELLKQAEEIISQSEKQEISINRAELRAHIVDYISSICTLEDIYVYKRVLESYRFTPIQNADIKNLDQQVQGIGFMQAEYKRWSKDYQNRTDGLERISNSGKNLLGEIDRLFIKSSMAGTKDQFVSVFQNIPNYLHTKLSSEQKKLWKLLETYVKMK